MKERLVESMRNPITTLTAVMAIGGSLIAAEPAKAKTTYLALGTYKQPHSASKPQVAKSSCPSMTWDHGHCTAEAQSPSPLVSKLKYLDCSVTSFAVSGPFGVLHASSSITASAFALLSYDFPQKGCFKVTPTRYG